MALSPGTKLGSYEISTRIGVGGMGEVYRAIDTNLKRQVAIKVLPDKVASDSERLARFQREAEVLAKLNHPNIAAIYGLERTDGGMALVMELVEGPTLADRIAQRRLSVDEAIPIARQIAIALEAAHEQGIIHRDVKPANVKIREDDVVKVLDFGLAKACEPTSPSGVDATASPTLTSVAMTATGVILGTAAYMSPEQAKGRPADKRSDVWAFGCVFYEMLTGKRAFEGPDAAETIVSVLSKEPDWDALPADTPPSIRRLLRWSLERDTRRRVPEIAVARFVIDEGLAEPVQETSLAVPLATRASIVRRLIPHAVVALLTAGLVASVFWVAVPPHDRRIARFTIPLGAGQTFYVNQALIALSPDGRRIAYVANGQIYLRESDQLGPEPIRGTEGGNNPFFSPDGRWIGFFANTRQIKKVPIDGGSPVTVGDVPDLFGASWGSDGSIVFAGGSSGIWRISAAGGTPEQLVKVDANEAAYGAQIVARGTAIVFALATNENWSEAQIVVQKLDTGQRRVLVKGGTDPRYLSTGHLVYARSGAIMAVPFDVDAMSVGTPVSVIDNVGMGGGRCNCRFGHFATSSEGALVYVPSPAYVGEPLRTLLWVDRNGTEEVINAPARPYLWPRLSPDATRIAIEVRDQDYDIWVWDLTRKTLNRVTSDVQQDSWPAWMPDGNRILFGRDVGTQRGLFSQAADGSGTVEPVMTVSSGTHAVMSVTPDGAHAVVARLEDDGYDLLLLPLNAPAGGSLGAANTRGLVGDAEPLIQTRFNEHNGSVSPDGRWLAYQSDFTGRWEIYVRPFPKASGGPMQISTAGGKEPLFAPGGGELFYRGLDDSVIAVTISPGKTWTSGTPKQLVPPGRYVGSTPNRSLRWYDVSGDGRRFLMVKESERPNSLVLVQNWNEEVKRLVSND